MRNERRAFIAGEVGEAAIWLILKGEEVSRAGTAEYLGKKRREVATQSTKAYCVTLLSLKGMKSYSIPGTTAGKIVFNPKI